MPETTLIKKQLEIDVKDFNKEEGTMNFILSSGMPDRHGEMIDQTSWNLDEYKKNPVVLWSHDAYNPPIAQMIKVGPNSDGMLEGAMKFAIDEYDFAKTIYNLLVGKFIRAVSVGFMSSTSEIINDITVLKDNILYEVSVVNIPADALALAKSKGIDISSLEKKEIVEKEVEKKEVVKEELEEKVGRVLSAKNRSVIEKAAAALKEVLKADTKGDKGLIISKRNKFNKTVNQAVRELLEAKKLK